MARKVTGLRRWSALGGVAGPVAFVAAWSILGASRAGYSPVHDPISRLAAVDAPSRTAMTAGFVAFGAGVGIYAPALRAALPGGAAAAAATTAAATVAIAALPLDSPVGDRPHAVAAAVAYASLAATPLLGARAFLRAGRPRAAFASVATGIGVGTALVASAVVPQGVGLAQRIGLSLGDAWIVTTALAVLRTPRPYR